MPDTACLHIQARDVDPVRVVELPGGPVRIGRAAYCDVHLPDAGLADEECRLRRRGGAWELVPVAPRGALRLGGRKVSRPVVLAIGTTFHVGSSRLTLQPSALTSPWTGQPSTEVVDIEPAEPAGTGLARVGPAEATAGERREQRERAARRWETRWRAAGETLRAASPPVAAGPAPSPPPSSEAWAARRVEPPPAGELPRRAEPPREPLVRRPETRAVPPATPPPSVAASAKPPASQVSAASRPAGYVPPAAPSARREPARASGWDRTPSPRRPLPPEPARVTRPTLQSPAPGPAAPFGPARAEAPAARPTAPARPAVTGSDPAPGEPTSADAFDVPRLEDVTTPIVGVDVDAQTRAVESVEVMGGPDVRDRPPETGPGRWEVVDPSRDDARPDSTHQEPIDAPSAAVTTRDVADGPEPAQATADEPRADDEPEAPRPSLGAARRGPRAARPTPPPAPAAEWARPVVEPAGPVKPVGTRWVTHRPVATHDDESLTTSPESPRGGWGYQTRFVTDTNTDFDGPGHAPEPGRDGGWEGSEPGQDRGAARGGPGTSPREWPTVSDILAAQGVRPGPSAPAGTSGTRKSAPRRRPEPTAAKAPGQWRLPLWLAWLPAAAAAAGVGAAGVAGSWVWAVDGYNAGLVAQRLAAAEPPKAPLPPGVAPAEGSWWRADAGQLAQWAAYLDRAGDPAGGAGEAVAVLDRAARVGPLNPSVRYAMARPRPGEAVAPELTLIRALGQSRDVPALAWAGHQLLAAGKTGPALTAYRAAMEMAAEAEPSRSAPPPFLDDPRVRRYAVPGEDRLGAVVRDMAGSSAWGYKDWSAALPRGSAAAVVAARVLRESGSPDADAALAAAQAEAEDADADAAGGAVGLAAGAEALAMSQRWADARDRYRRAIELMPADAVRRAWWVNVADLSARLDEEPERQKALESAKVADLRDEVTRRAVDLQRAAGPVPRRPRGRVSEARR